MKTINRHVGIAALAAALTGAAASGEEEHYPTIAEVDAKIASISNLRGASVMWWEFESMSGRIKDLQDKYPTQEVLRVQWHVVSNMFADCYLTGPLTNDVQINHAGMENIIWLHLTKYKLFHADTNALMYVADCVSNALPVDVSRETAVVLAGMRGEYMPEFGSTNALTGVKLIFDYHSATNHDRLWLQWETARRTKSGFNFSQTSFRRQVFNCFCELMLHDFSEYPEPVRRSLWEEFCRRAGATDPEKAEAYRNLYADYKIVYP